MFTSINFQFVVLIQQVVIVDINLIKHTNKSKVVVVIIDFIIVFIVVFIIVFIVVFIIVIVVAEISFCAIHNHVF